MDGNKDEALKSLKIAESALKSNDKTRALKFLKIAKRLDPNLKIDHLSSLSPKSPKNPNPQIPPSNHPKPNPNSTQSEPSIQSYTEENVKSIREIRKTKDYYAILGLQKTSTNEEIKKAYKKLSLKIHPDKNKAPGAEEAFKSLSKAFNCLNNEQSRLNYDQTGSENCDFALQNDDNHFAHRRASRRRYYNNGYYEEDFDHDEIFRSFFFGGSQERVNRARNFNNRQRNYRNTPQNQNTNMAEVQNTVILVVLVCIILFFLIASLPFLESEYSLQKSQTYHITKSIEGFNVEYFVKREDFDMRFPKGESERANLEAQVLRDFKNLIGRYCHAEMQRKFWDSSYATPYCDRLRSFQTV